MGVATAGMWLFRGRFSKLLESLTTEEEKSTAQYESDPTNPYAPPESLAYLEDRESP